MSTSRSFECSPPSRLQLLGHLFSVHGRTNLRFQFLDEHTHLRQVFINNSLQVRRFRRIFCPKWRSSSFGSASEAVKTTFLLLAVSAAFHSLTRSYWCPAPNLLAPSERHSQNSKCVSGS